MFIFLLTLSICLTFLFVYLPLRNDHKDRLQREFDAEVRLLKLQVVRHYYESLDNMSYKQIAEKYDVDSAYYRL